MWKLTQYSSCVGAFILIATFLLSNGAPQQAAGAAVGIGFAVIPYCIARAQSELKIQKSNKEVENENYEFLEK